MADVIYLDNNATTRPLPAVVEAMAHHFRESFANPGSRHRPGRRARQALEDAREQVAAVLDADPSEVVLTSGGTESSNMAIMGFGQQEPGVIVTTAGEHPATVQSCRQLQARGWVVHHLPVDAEGLIRADALDDVAWDSVHLATVILAHNETGVIQDLAPLAERCAQHQVPLHVDAVQAVGKIPVSFRSSGATTMALGAHKFHGPRGIGALLVRTGTRLAPLQFGGHQERGLRPGTESVALAVGMATALTAFHDEQQQRMQRLRMLRDRLQASLLEQCAPAVVHGAREHRLPNTLSIAFTGLHGDALLVALDLEGVACSLGSTCASGAAEPAPALVAMGVPSDLCIASVRFSVGIENTDAEIDEAISRIAAVVTRMRSDQSSP